MTPFARQLRAFATVARSNGATDVTDGRGGVSTVRLVAACRDSIRSGGAWIAVESLSTNGCGDA